ncbi:MAG: hypothetical protein WCQ69_09965 [Bacteroidales bacterium]|jgi:hypothetical protein|nr:hypothetical protein [Candidatus Omnitrophota bacterium]
MAATKGKVCNPKGRGHAPNKGAARIAEDIVAAYKELGGMQYLIQLAQEDRKTFCTLLLKILPNNIKADVDVKGQLAHFFEQIDGLSKGPPSAR